MSLNMMQNHVQSTHPQHPYSLRQAVPEYDAMRQHVTDVTSQVLDRRLGVTVMDLGSGSGESIEPLLERHPTNTYVCVDNQMSRIHEMETKFADQSNIELKMLDLNDPPVWMQLQQQRPQLIMSIFSMMFVHLENRQRLIQAIHDVLPRGGCFVMVEHTLGETGTEQDFLSRIYVDQLGKKGYKVVSPRHAWSSCGVAEPLRPSWNEQMLTDAGFVHMSRFWSSLFSVGWICHKIST